MAKKPATPKKSAASATPPAAVFGGAVELIGDVPTEGKRVTDKGLGIIEVMAANAQSKATIARALGVDHKTLARIAERRPEVAEAMEYGRGALSDELASGFLQQFRKGNTTAGIFLAKCMAGWRENDTRGSGTPRVGIQIVMPDSLSEADYLKRLPVITAKETGE